MTDIYLFFCAFCILDYWLHIESFDLFIVPFTCLIIVLLILVDRLYWFFFFSHLVMLLVSCGMLIWFILTHYFIIVVVDSTCFDVLIALLNYYHNTLTSSYHMKVYPIFCMYTLVVAYF